MLKKLFSMLVVTIIAFGSVVLPVSAAGNTKFGMSQGSSILSYSDSEMNSVLNGMVDAGVGYLRIDIAWSLIESTKGTYNWTATDRVVNAAIAKGLKILALPTSSPSWAGTAWNYPPNNGSDYQNFVYQAGKHYIPKGVLDWELWNEANIQNMNGATYTSKILKPGSTGIRQAASELGKTVNVLTSGLSPDGNQNTFLSAIYSNGGKSYFNNVAYHPYCSNANAGDTNGNFMQQQQLYNIMTSNGDSSKKIWITEFGMTTGGAYSWTEAEQALFIPAAYAIWKSWSWAGPFIVYEYRDQGTSSTDREDHFGLVRNDWTVKTALSRVKDIITDSSTTGSKYEAEYMGWWGCNSNSQGSGWTGSGHVDGIDGAVGNNITFNVCVATAGSHNINFRYSNGTGSIKKLSVYVNGTNIKDVNFAATGDWNTTWATVQSTFTLNAGSNVIRIQCDSGDGPSNIDYIRVY